MIPEDDEGQEKSDSRSEEKRGSRPQRKGDSRSHVKRGPRPLRPPMERFETVRKEIIEVLTRFGPMTARELSAEVRVRERDVHDHLRHIKMSLEKSGKRLVMIPAECRRCGFVFDDRSRVTKPGKCPQCRGTSIDEPEFKVM